MCLFYFAISWLKVLILVRLVWYKWYNLCNVRCEYIPYGINTYVLILLMFIRVIYDIY
jgi:hypothetical protein